MLVSQRLDVQHRSELVKGCLSAWAPLLPGGTPSHALWHSPPPANGQCRVHLRDPPAPGAGEGAHQGGAVQVHPAHPGAGAEGELPGQALSLYPARETGAWVRRVADGAP